MSTIGSSITGTVGSTIGAGTLANVSMPLANTEYSYTLPAGTKKFVVQNREEGLIKLTYTALASGTLFWTLFPGTQTWEEDISNTATITLYFQSPGTAQLLEVMTWS